MPGTSKSLRQAPPRRFENYTLNHVCAPGVGLSEVSDESMTLVLSGYVTNQVSNFVDIGFPFSFDGITYKRLLICSNGWMALADPTTTSITVATGSLVVSGSSDNRGISMANVTNNVLIAPWFDDLRTIAPSVTGSLTSDQQRRVNEGLQPPPIDFNEHEFGVKIHRGSSPQGRRTIVRWNVLNSSTTSATTKLRFDATLYENGKIEFRYIPKNQFKHQVGTVSSTEGATCGIFMPGTARFRDFSLGLGHQDERRQMYRFGGTVMNASYMDLTGSVHKPYVFSLKSSANWPARYETGAMFVFAPPVNRRKVLPRLQKRVIDAHNMLPSVARTGDVNRLGNSKRQFDDRKTATYTLTGTVLVNYPTTLPRFFGSGERSAADRHDLFSGDFELTGNISKAAADDFLGETRPTLIAPFTEHRLYENDAANVESTFYTTGSNVDTLGYALAYPLKSKTKIKIELPINYTTTMFATSASIYYYNKALKAWQIPAGTLSGSYGWGSNSDIRDSRAAGTPGQLATDDQRGFGPIGNRVNSGTIDVYAVYALNTHTFTDAMGTTFAKSIPINSEYTADENETFSLPITQPFVIEKAVIEFPIEAGNGWFQDLTTTFTSLSGSALDFMAWDDAPDISRFDFAGPALTISLFNQMSFDNGRFRRDLILTGTITHQLDNTSTLVMSRFGTVTTGTVIRPEGFLAYASPPSVVVTPISSSAGYSFTGSVVAKCTALVSNGLLLDCQRVFGVPASSIPDRRTALRELFAAPDIQTGYFAADTHAQYMSINSVSNFGRGSTGFDPSGRSVFGQEFAASQDLKKVQNRIRNPFYISGSNAAQTGSASGLPAQIDAAIQGDTKFRARAAIPLLTHKASPYLVYPGDKLILAISKTRPFLYAANTGGVGAFGVVSGSRAHDIKLKNGSVSITLYGSLLQEGREYHDTLNQELSSDAIHEIVIGNEPVLDQFEVDYRESYVGGMRDDYVTGTLAKKITGTNQIATIETGRRGRVISGQAARTAGYPTTGIDSFDSQAWWERVGIPRVTAAVDESERYWDSLMPDVIDCFSADGTRIFIESSDSLDNYGNSLRIDKPNTGYVIFDHAEVGDLETRNSNWTWAYPFEPRYSHVARQETLSNLFTSERSVDGAETLTPSPSTELSGFFFGPGFSFTPGTGTGGSYLFISDRTRVVNATTGSATPDDMARGLFGFGDLNCISLVTASNSRVGTNHFAEYRNVSRNRNVLFNFTTLNFATSPLIRGWKYGVHSGLPTYSKSYFRHGQYGQFRDMLEQRPYTRFYKTTTHNLTNKLAVRKGTGTAVVTIKFVDSDGKITNPENTWSQNLSFEATSSMPYFDGETRNRPDLNTKTLNVGIVGLKQSPFQNLTL